MSHTASSTIVFAHHRPRLRTVEVQQALEADPRWSEADDIAVTDLFERERLEGSCSPRPKVERAPSIFDRVQYCPNPRGVDRTTGEITDYDWDGNPRPCRSRLCETCGPDEAIRLSFKTMKAKPGKEFTLTQLGDSPEEFKKRFSKLVGIIRTQYGPFEHIKAVEVPPDNHSHVHCQGYAKTQINGRSSRPQPRRPDSVSAN
jgi:hypothetical protein